jgi:hypothetical protein
MFYKLRNIIVETNEKYQFLVALVNLSLMDFPKP